MGELILKYQPEYLSYHSFLKANKNAAKFKDLEYYLEKFAFVRHLAETMPCLIYMLDFSTQKYLYFSESCENITGYSAREFIAGGQSWSVSCLHPDDQEIIKGEVFTKFLAHSLTMPADELKKCRFSVNYRFKRKEGVYVKLLQQYVILEMDDKNYPLLSLGICTDITAHKSDDKVVFSLSHYDKKRGLKTISTESFSNTEIKLTAREIEIVRHLIDGHNTKQIAEKLFVSPFTIQAHRRNILEKTNCKNTAELVSAAVRFGWAY